MRSVRPIVTSAYRPMRSYSATSNVESWYGSQQAKTAPARISPIRTGAGHGTRALDRRVRLVRRARDLRPRAPADEDEHDDQGDGQAVLRVDVADHELLEDPERVAAEQREADRAEAAEDGRGEAVHRDRDVRAVRHRVARREQRAAERAESARAGKRDDRERADVEADELGGAPRVRARDERLSDDRPAEEERQRDGAQERDACDEHVLRLDEDAPMFHARSEMPG